MARALRPIDITNIPDVLRIVEQVRRSNEPVVLRQDSEDLAILRPVKRSRTGRSGRGKPFTLDDPLWNLVGAGSSGLGDVSRNKHKYLAEVYLSHPRKG
ncbi:MAG: hypothetical protein M1396_06115 [Chloroflexi bacterium]|nr:hypothetical protein [Chloroflexota bacterium]